MLKTAVLAALAAVCLSLPADARPRHVAHHRYDPACNVSMPCEIPTRAKNAQVADRKEAARLARGQALYDAMPFGMPTDRAGRILPHPVGCPRRAFCGCGASVEVFGKPVRSLWLAANWLRFPRAAPAPGMVAARRGHVFVIKRVLGGGKVLAYDANSGGHKTRLHVRSLAGFVVVDPSGAVLWSSASSSGATATVVLRRYRWRPGLNMMMFFATSLTGSVPAKG
jgi:hypothetical protein